MRVLPVPHSPEHVNLRELMKLLGEAKIDSILLEGGGVLNNSALRSGIVQEVKGFIAPKLFGGGGKTPVEGNGVNFPDEAVLMELEEVSAIDRDLMISWRVRDPGKEQLCSQAL